METEKLNKSILEARKKLREELEKVQQIVLATSKTVDAYLESLEIKW